MFRIKPRYLYPSHLNDVTKNMPDEESHIAEFIQRDGGGECGNEKWPIGFHLFEKIASGNAMKDNEPKSVHHASAELRYWTGACE